MLRPALAMALRSQVLTDWAKVPRHSLSSAQVDQVYVDLADQLVQDLQYFYDASLDAALLFYKLYILAIDLWWGALAQILVF